VRLQLLALVISSAVLGAMLSWVGCGGPDLVVGGMLPATATAGTTPTTTCGQPGDPCGTNSDCCSGNCFTPDGINLQCA